jgi:hypothetical protein
VHVTEIRALLRRATSLRRQILGAGALIIAAIGVAAIECIKLLGHPTVQMSFALACAMIVVAATVTWGRRLARELLVLRANCARMLASSD